MDEVPIKAGRTKGAAENPDMKQTYFWPLYGDSDEVAFTRSNSRGMLHAQAQLGLSGTLLTDGYALTQNGSADKPTRTDCARSLLGTHAQGQKKPSTVSRTPRSRHWISSPRFTGMKNIRHKQLDLADIRHRKQHSEPSLPTSSGGSINSDNALITPKSPFAKALHYAHERESQLKVFLGNPALPMDTNHLERALRVIPMGRKNYLFCWSELGAEQLGILQSLMVTCRLQGVNPYHYLVDVLQRVALHPARDVIDLTPRLWKQKYNQNRLVSDVKILTSQH